MRRLRLENIAATAPATLEIADAIDDRHRARRRNSTAQEIAVGIGTTSAQGYRCRTLEGPVMPERAAFAEQLISDSVTLELALEQRTKARSTIRPNESTDGS